MIPLFDTTLVHYGLFCTAGIFRPCLLACHPLGQFVCIWERWPGYVDWVMALHWMLLLQRHVSHTNDPDLENTEGLVFFFFFQFRQSEEAFLGTFMDEQYCSQQNYIGGPSRIVFSFAIFQSSKSSAHRFNGSANRGRQAGWAGKPKPALFELGRS